MTATPFNRLKTVQVNIPPLLAIFLGSIIGSFIGAAVGVALTIYVFAVGRLLTNPATPGGFARFPHRTEDNFRVGTRAKAVRPDSGSAVIGAVMDTKAGYDGMLFSRNIGWGLMIR